MKSAAPDEWQFSLQTSQLQDILDHYQIHTMKMTYEGFLYLYIGHNL